MGFKMFSASEDSAPSVDFVPAYYTPDPCKFTLIEVTEYAYFTYCETSYLDCKTFEGIKIIVYEGRCKNAIDSAAKIDPHFSDVDNLSPIARFKPTEHGRMLARLFAMQGMDKEVVNKILQKDTPSASFC